MKIEIDKSILEKYNFDFEKNINLLLKFVPESHLTKLDKIKIVNCEGRKIRKYGGYYSGESEGCSPVIVICANHIFQGCPKIFFYIPFFPRLFLASNLYHEIGHHYQRLQHGIKKEDWEKDAENYTKTMEKIVFRHYRWILFVFFGPILLIRKLFRK